MSSTSPAPAPSPADLPADVPAAEATAPEAGASPDASAPQDEAVAASKDTVSAAATSAKLAELFPALFKGAPKPLKLRIQVDIQERAPGVFSKQALSAFFRRYTGATSYLIAVSKGKQRFDLDGQPAGELSDEHRKVAADELARRRAATNARREQEEAGRRQRASLLRDFETTKLTTANFCALKGIAPDQLDGLLAQARAEALEDAQRPRRPEHGHGGPGHRPGGHRPEHGRGGPDRRGEGGHGGGKRPHGAPAGLAGTSHPRGGRPGGQAGQEGTGSRPPRNAGEAGGQQRQGQPREAQREGQRRDGARDERDGGQGGAPRKEARQPRR